VYLLSEADNEFRRTTAEHAHRDIPGSALELVPGTGHYMQFEVPDAVVRTIERAARDTSGVHAEQ
jgi:pimeloyl-ACP methyl ester carboxylesterase